MCDTRSMRGVAVFLLAACALCAQPKRVLFITTSAGFRHASIEVAKPVLALAGGRANVAVTSTEDLALISRDGLAGYDAVFFFTSGELALSDAQKQALLDFVRSGKGFGGAHSATDTLYSWPAYGDLIGGYFDGHPWVQDARIDVEDAQHPATRGLPVPSFSMVEEYYQFRAFSRDAVRVLLTLDTNTIDLAKPGVNRTDQDFALAWVREYGAGRVFYTALGHFDETWQDPRFQTMLTGALLWLTRQAEGSAEPWGGERTAAPAVTPRDIAPGAALEFFGARMTSGAALAADARAWPPRLAGVSLRVNGTSVPLLFASPGQINALLPWDLVPGASARLSLAVGTRDIAVWNAPVLAAQPVIRAVTRSPGALVLWCTGLGDVTRRPALGRPAPASPLSETVARPVVTLGGQNLPVFFSGLAPGWVGLYQVNVALAGDQPAAGALRLAIAGLSATADLP